MICFEEKIVNSRKINVIPNITGPSRVNPVLKKKKIKDTNTVSKRNVLLVDEKNCSQGNVSIVHGKVSQTKQVLDLKIKFDVRIHIFIFQSFKSKNLANTIKLSLEIK